MTSLDSMEPLRLAYTVLLPLIEQMLHRFFQRSLRAKQRRESGLQHVSSSVVHEAVHMIRTVKCFSREDKHLALVSLAASGMAKVGQAEKVQLGRLKHGAAQLLPDISQRAVCHSVKRS